MLQKSYGKEIKSYNYEIKEIVRLRHRKRHDLKVHYKEGNSPPTVSYKVYTFVLRVI